MILKGRSDYPLGMYEQPRTEEEWEEWNRAGINLLRCRNREQLDAAAGHGMMGWVPVRMIVGSDEEEAALSQKVESLRDHPALVVWEAPDEAIWNACRLDDGKVTTRIWSQPGPVREMLDTRLDNVVGGLERGTSIVRQLDPLTKIWLNEACETDQDTLARCTSLLDIIGFDYYPITQMNSDGNTMCHIGRYAERFRGTAPNKEIWVVQQAFSWSSIRSESGRPRAYPTVEEYRFMAWNAIAHGATGLLWWGSHREERPSPFLHDLMTVVSELRALRSFLLGGNVPGSASGPTRDNTPPCPEYPGSSAARGRRRCWPSSTRICTTTM